MTPPKTPEERAAWVAQMKAKVAALSPEERERRFGALIAAITPDLMIVDEDGDALAVDDVSDERGRSIYIDVCAAGTDDGMAVRFDEERVRKLRDHLTAWLDAPRLAARAAAEVVAEDDGVRLLKTTAGEWGTEESPEHEGYPPGEAPAPGVEISRETFGDGSVLVVRRGKRHWFETEDLARASFAFLRGKRICESCSAEVDEDELTEAGEDGPMVCSTCADELREEFKATRFTCPGLSTLGPCGWTGTGADAVVEDGEVRCPRCTAAVEEVDEPVTEAPNP